MIGPLVKGGHYEKTQCPQLSPPHIGEDDDFPRSVELRSVNISVFNYSIFGIHTSSSLGSVSPPQLYIEMDDVQTILTPILTRV